MKFFGFAASVIAGRPETQLRFRNAVISHIVIRARMLCSCESFLNFCSSTSPCHSSLYNTWRMHSVTRLPRANFAPLTACPSFVFTLRSCSLLSI